MNFLQFFVWGAWLITIGTYCINSRGWSFPQFGAIFSTMGLASIFMPTIMGVIADRWINTERIYGALHIGYGICLFFVPRIDSPNEFYYIILAAMICYMPTIALSNSIAFAGLKNSQMDVIKDFPPIRVWGTVGFIAAMWCTNFLGFSDNANQFYLASLAAVALGLYSFSLPACPPQHIISKDASLFEQLGLNAFSLLKQYRIAVFLLFSMFLGASLQLTNMYGDAFLRGFESMQEYQNAFAVRNSTFIMSISQISETLFILTIPFFMKRFGIKKVMLIAMLAWTLRFGLFAIGNPGSGLWAIVLSCIVYGMAFDFFNISGYLFIENNTDTKMRSSAQGLFMMMTNGFGAWIGSTLSGWIIDRYFVIDGVKNWQGIWTTFAIYSLIVAILFLIFFKHEHKPDEKLSIAH